MLAEEGLLSTAVIVVERHKRQQRKFLQIRNQLVFKQQYLFEEEVIHDEFRQPTLMTSIRSRMKYEPEH